MSELNIYKVRKTCLEMLFDRGYKEITSTTLFDQMKNETFEEF